MIDNDIRALAELLASRPGLKTRITVNGKIDRQLLRAEISREEILNESAGSADQNGLRPRRGKGGGPRGRQVSPSPWAREHPKWDPK